MAVSAVTLISILIVYLVAVVYLTWYGYKRTKNAEDFMVCGRNINSYVLAISYGATFISTSAIVGFGGVAGLLGMGLLWLTFLNIFVGIFIAFMFFGPRTRKIGANLGVLTFPELLGKRFNSKFIQSFSGLLIFLFMPLYAGIVLIGAARFIEVTLNIDYNVALIGVATIIALYVVIGGLITVMYTDAFQGSIMFIGMAFLLLLTYAKLGGITEAHAALTSMASLVPESLQAGGHTGWTSFPTFDSPIWWTLVSSLILGVGIGVLAQPQLAVRFIAAKSKATLFRAMAVGGIFIFMMTGVAFLVGALSNVYFYENYGKIAVAMVGGNIDLIIPTYINDAMPEVLVVIFMLTLVAAAMSTLSSQFHAMGTSLGYDFYKNLRPASVGKRGNVHITRMGIFITIIISIVLAYILPISIIARATAIFFGLCAAAFLPIYTGALFWKRMNRQGAIAGLVTGTTLSLFWLAF
ncbi:MAG: sodium:solute symporter family protein, partial [Methermicoccaceae archaeon]